MSSCTICPLCAQPGTYDTAAETALVPCNVRSLTQYRFPVWRCQQCNSLHSLDDADLPFFYEHFPFQKHQLDFHARIGYGNRLRFLKRLGLKKSDRILDYGCGTGLFVEFLKEQGYGYVDGYDAYVPAYANEEVLAETYDVLVSYDVIEHVDDPRAMMRTVVSLVKQGGLVALGTPNANFVHLDPDNLLTPELSQPYHRHILSEQMLVRLANEQGMEVAHTSHRFYFDSLVPGVNTRFMWSYIAATGGYIDAAVEPPQTGLVARSPKLWLQALLGYFFPPKGNMLVTFRKTGTTHSSPEPVERVAVEH